MTKMMSRQQGWALFCITKKDYRNENLTYNEASDLIKKFGNPEYVKKAKNTVVKKANGATEIMNKAYQAGMEALNKCVPVPMVVEQHVNVMDDKSPVTKAWHVANGVCGFASITFKANTTKNRSFMNALKKEGLLSNDINDFNEKVLWKKRLSGPGYTYWIREGGQSLQKKEAFAYAFNQVLADNGIEAHVMSGMD
jgi:hypothetical protein